MLDSEDEEPPEDPPEQSIEDEQHDDAPADDQAVPASPQQPPVAVAPRHIADMSTMSKEILQAMMPGVEVYEADMHEGFQMCP